jgi:hypothetical protein
MRNLKTNERRITMNKSIKIVGAVALIAFLLCVRSISTQPVWHDLPETGSATLEMIIPQFDDDEYTQVSGITAFVTLRIPTQTNFLLVMEIPWARVSLNREAFYWSSPFSASEASLGNVLVGAEIRGKNSDLFTEVGLRLPTSNEEKSDVLAAGLISDIDRWGAFGDYFSVLFAANYRRQTSAGMISHLRVGPTWLKYDTEGCSGCRSSDIFLQYSCKFGMQSQQLGFMAGLSGVMSVTGDDMNFGERTLHQLGVTATYDAGQMRTSVTIKAPLDKDMREALNSTVGVGISYLFK